MLDHFRCQTVVETEVIKYRNKVIKQVPELIGSGKKMGIR